MKIPIRFVMHFFTLLDQSKNKCVRDDELKKDLENDELYDKLFTAKAKLRLNLDIQNFQRQCFSVNHLLNKHGLFLRVCELKDKF